MAGRSATDTDSTGSSLERQLLPSPPQASASDYRHCTAGCIASHCKLMQSRGSKGLALVCRPVPLEMQFIGVTPKAIFEARNVMDEVCYKKVRPTNCALRHCPSWPCTL